MPHDDAGPADSARPDRFLTRGPTGADPPRPGLLPGRGWVNLTGVLLPISPQHLRTQAEVQETLNYGHRLGLSTRQVDDTVRNGIARATERGWPLANALMTQAAARRVDLPWPAPRGSTIAETAHLTVALRLWRDTVRRELAKTRLGRLQLRVFDAWAKRRRRTP